MVEAGLTEKVLPDPVYRFRFPDCAPLPPPVMGFKEVSFSYSGKKEDYLYQNLNFGIDLDSRIALCAPRARARACACARAAPRDVPPRATRMAQPALQHGCLLQRASRCARRRL